MAWTDDDNCWKNNPPLVPKRKPDQTRFISADELETLMQSIRAKFVAANGQGNQPGYNLTVNSAGDTQFEISSGTQIYKIDVRDHIPR